MSDSRNFYPCGTAVVNLGLIPTLPAPGGLATLFGQFLQRLSPAFLNSTELT